MRNKILKAFSSIPVGYCDFGRGQNLSNWAYMKMQKILREMLEFK